MVVVLLAALAIRLAPLLLAPNDYAGTPSIEARADYRPAELMARAWALPAARAYRQSPWLYQPNQSFCGPTSLANVARSLGMATMTPASAIDGSRYEPWFGILIGGMTLDQLADLARQRLGRPVTISRGAPLVEFRRLMATSNDPGQRIIANFHRGPLFGRGHGHFSPILGYLADRDLVLVGDVNAKFRPFLVATPRLWQAVNTLDADTNKPRGLIVVAAPLLQQAPEQPAQ